MCPKFCSHPVPKHTTVYVDFQQIRRPHRSHVYHIAENCLFLLNFRIGDSSTKIGLMGALLSCNTLNFIDRIKFVSFWVEVLIKKRKKKKNARFCCRSAENLHLISLHTDFAPLRCASNPWLRTPHQSLNFLYVQQYLSNT